MKNKRISMSTGFRPSSIPRDEDSYRHYILDDKLCGIDNEFYQLLLSVY